MNAAEENEAFELIETLLRYLESTYHQRMGMLIERGDDDPDNDARIQRMVALDDRARDFVQKCSRFVPALGE